MGIGICPLSGEPMLKRFTHNPSTAIALPLTVLVLQRRMQPSAPGVGRTGPRAHVSMGRPAPIGLIAGAGIR